MVDVITEVINSFSGTDQSRRISTEHNWVYSIYIYIHNMIKSNLKVCLWLKNSRWAIKSLKS